MATVNNVFDLGRVLTNPTLTPPQAFNAIWSLTRCLKKAGWKYKASGDGAASKDTTQDPANDLWGGFSGSVSNGGAAAASVTVVSRGRATVTGLSGVVSADKGRFLRIQGSGSGNNGYHQIEEILSPTSVRIDARRIAITAPDANNGAITWEIYDPQLNTMPALTGAAWWCAQGPSILKIPITAAPVPGVSTGLLFLRGENISQGSSTFEGEILGYVFDSATGSGYLVVAPRLRGTGGGRFGLTTGQVLTGSFSGCTVTQNGTALEFARQITFWKTTASETLGAIYIGTFDLVANSGDLCETLAASAGCTAVVAPGGGGTGNAFPTRSYVMLGTNTTGTGLPWNAAVNVSAYTPSGRAQSLCADAIEEAGWSADGSWWWLITVAASQQVSGCAGLGYQRVDDIEDGDLDPYISWSPTLSTLYGNNRTSAGAARTASDTAQFSDFSFDSQVWDDTSLTPIRGWRGFGLTGETRQDFTIALLRSLSGASPVNVLSVSSSDADRLSTVPGFPKVREPAWAVSTQVGRRMRKGTIRWLGLTNGSGVGALYDDKRWIQVSNYSPAGVVGPWDGVSSPLLT